MPRYLFNVADCGDAHRVGLDLPNTKAARGEAVKAACGILSEYPDHFWDAGGDWQMTVTDEHGLTLFTLIFYAANAPAGARYSMNGDRRPL